MGLVENVGVTYQSRHEQLEKSKDKVQQKNCPGRGSYMKTAQALQGDYFLAYRARPNMSQPGPSAGAMNKTKNLPNHPSL